MRCSVEAYNIYGLGGHVLFNGDIVNKKWGGGGSPSGGYSEWEFHKLSISRTGELKISGCENTVRAVELVWTDPRDTLFNAVGLNKRYKVYL